MADAVVLGTLCPVTSDPIPSVSTLADLRTLADECQRCPLGATRQNLVFGEGDPHAPLVVVGEAPGRLEDETGRPFIGQSGKLLTLLLEEAGATRDEVYITSVLKSRPPENRDPKPFEIEACLPWLDEQLRLIAPKVILTVGNFPTRTLLGVKAGVTSLRGTSHTRPDGILVVPTFHPAAVLRSRAKLRPLAEADVRLAVSLAGLGPGA